MSTITYDPEEFDAVNAAVSRIRGTDKLREEIGLVLERAGVRNAWHEAGKLLEEGKVGDFLRHHARGIGAAAALSGLGSGAMGGAMIKNAGPDGIEHNVVARGHGADVERENDRYDQDKASDKSMAKNPHFQRVKADLDQTELAQAHTGFNKHGFESKHGEQIKSDPALKAQHQDLHNRHMQAVQDHLKAVKSHPAFQDRNHPAYEYLHNQHAHAVDTLKNDGPNPYKSMDIWNSFNKGQ